MGVLDPCSWCTLILKASFDPEGVLLLCMCLRTDAYITLLTRLFVMLSSQKGGKCSVFRQVQAVKCVTHFFQIL